MSVEQLEDYYFDERVEEQRLQFVSEYTGSSNSVIETLIRLDDKQQKRMASLVIMAIDTILGLGGKE